MSASTRSTLAVLASTLLLLGAAIWNRFPLTFWDTRAYLVHSVTLAPRLDRVIGYSLFIRAWSWTGSLWSVVAVQSGALAWLLWLVARLVLRRPDPFRFVVTVGLLAALSALPWIAGQLMPDIFTPILVLALFGLIVGAIRIRRGEQVLLAVTIAIAAAVHVTHAVFGVMLIVVLMLTNWPNCRSRPSQLRSALLGLLAIGAGLGGMLGFNYSRNHRWELVGGGSAFLLAHLVESGAASRLLDEHCGERAYALCPYRASLPMTTDELLWQDRLPFHPFEQLEVTQRETHRLLLDSWREHPGQQLAVGFEYSLGALSRFGTGEGLDSLALPGLDSAVALVAPGDRPALAASRQQHDQVPVSRLRAIDTPVGWAFLLAALAVVIVALSRGGRWRADRSVQFLVTALLSVVLYAVLCGNTSGIYDRYESRLVWLCGFGLWLAAEARYRRQKRRAERSEGT
ncbi:MAG: hypothetical protein ABJC74_16875, partial [Gemmatimonadota bacterium]